MKVAKKIVCVFMCVCLLATAFVGCSQTDQKYTVKEITDEIKTYNDIEIVWTNLKREEISAYLGFTADKTKNLSVYINDAEEDYDIAAAFEFDSEKDLTDVIEALNKSLSAAADSFKNTSLTEAQKISNRLVLKKGTMLVVIVSTNYEEINKVLKNKGFVSVEK